MKISILAETFKFDLKCYQNLFRKVLKDCFNFKDISYLPSDPSLFFGTKGKLLKTLDIKVDILSKLNPDLICLFVDSDDFTLPNQKKIINKKLNLLQNFSKEQVIIGIPQRNIEAWFLANIYTTHTQIKKEISDFVKVETIKDPQGEFKRIWREIGKNKKYEQFASEIILTIDVDKLASRSDSFLDFLKDLKLKLKRFNLNPSESIIKVISKKKK